MEPGKELDALIAKKVMGVTPKRIAIATNDGGKSSAATEGGIFSESDIKQWVKDHPLYELGYWEYYAHYSTDLGSAWQVVEKFYWVSLGRGKGGVWACEFREYEKLELTKRGLSPMVGTAPHAICLAALKFLNIKVESTDKAQHKGN